MECPSCREQVEQKERGDGELVFYCPACGWGKENLAASGGSRASPSRTAWLKLAGLWVLSLAIILGPWAGLAYWQASLGAGDSGGTASAKAAPGSDASADADGKAASESSGEPDKAEKVAERMREKITASGERFEKRVVDFLVGWYWLILAAYLAIAAVVTPSYDPESTGLFGGAIDDPTTAEDNFHRAMRTLAMILAPGKIVCSTVSRTVRLGIDAAR